LSSKVAYWTKLTGRRSVPECVFLLAALLEKILSGSLNNGPSNFLVVWLTHTSLINSSHVDILAFSLPSFDPAAIFLLKHVIKTVGIEAVSVTLSVFTLPDRRTT
jgi:hypothetical protein